MGIQIRRIGRQGASLSLTIPRELADVLHLRRGDEVLLERQGDALLIRKLTPQVVEAMLPTDSSAPEPDGA